MPRVVESQIKIKSLRIDSNPEVPEGDWYKDIGSFKSAATLVSENVPPSGSDSQGNGGLMKGVFMTDVIELH